jgi:hypothetical protein
MAGVKSENSKNSNEFIVAVANMTRRMADFGLRPGYGDELADGIGLTERLIGGALAPFSVVENGHIRTQISAWVTGSPVDGLYLIAPLTTRGVAAVRTAAFNPADPAEAHIAAAGAACAGVYIGVYAGETHAARKSLMTASAVLRVEIFGRVPCFARAATPDGARSMLSLGFVPVIGGMPDLFVSEALSASASEAA